MLGAIVLATTPNEFDSEEPTTPAETTAGVHTTATPKNNNLSVSEVKRLPSIAVTSSALQTPLTHNITGHITSQRAQP